MGKRQERSWVFTPGAIGVGTIVIPGNIRLEQILLITNVTRNIILYNFADVAYASTTVVHTASDQATNFPKITQRESGYTTITLRVNTTSHNANDRLSILIEETEALFRPFRFGTDAIERIRISQGQSMIDADFEYGLQPTKWAAYGLVRGYNSIYEIPGVDLTITSIITEGQSPKSTISLVTNIPHGISPGQAVSVTGVNDNITGFSRADGLFFVSSASNVTITYTAWGVVGSAGQSLLSDATNIRRAGIYTGATLNVASISGGGTTMTVTFNSNHGLVPGSPIFASASGGTNPQNATGPFYVTSVPSAIQITYTAVATSSPTSVAIYCISGAQIIHRPFDGGVILSTGVPSYGANVIRISKKYFRYQSGKGLLWSTGTLFKPNYDIENLTQSGSVAGSTLTITVDNIVHGLQVGCQIRVEGFTATPEYNQLYTVASIVDDYAFTVTTPTAVNPSGPTFGQTQKVVVENWHGATIRAGCFDDQNGMFWEFDGMNICVVRRAATQQLLGLVTINSNSNQVTGATTKFRSQVRAGDKIVIRGMTHVVTAVNSDTSMFVNPDYRGSTNAVQVKASIVIETRARQQEFNIDRFDGTGPSGFVLNFNRMHMLGIQYTWYGAGFIDFMCRGSDGNWLFAHRIKNNNINYEAHMRTGNLPVRYSIENEPAVNSYLTAAMTSIQNTITLQDNTFYPNTGTVYIDNELINYTGKSGLTLLTGCTRAATLTQWINGGTQSFTAGTADIHSVGTGVLLISNYASPTLSHWGSALLCDGMFDNDRGYIFSYQRTDQQIVLSNGTSTQFVLRLAPSVSNGQIGNLGTRDLLNRSTLLLQSITISTSRSANQPNSVICEGVLNPKNLTGATYFALNGESVGGQPSFAQIGTSPSFSSGTYALPGEQVFAFACNPNSDATLDLTQLKELSNSPFGGSGVYPDGPDTLAINVRVSGGQSGSAEVRLAILLRWSEAQA